MLLRQMPPLRTEGMVLKGLPMDQGSAAHVLQCSRQSLRLAVADCPAISE